VLVANVDQVTVMVAAARPEPNLRMIDRFLVLAEANDLPAMIIVNKIDLLPEPQARALFRDYEAAGYEVLPVSVHDGVGLDAVRARLCGRDSVVTGPSGVGKSSLLNLLQPGLALRTSEISDAVTKGRHTTVAAQLIPLDCGGYVVDTPGIREVGLFEINAESLDICFPEFREYIGDCKFTTSCTHTHEPDCAVHDAARAGRISMQRYDSYRDLYSQMSPVIHKR
jgi:ribosome biogenesis GTPase